MPEFVFLDSKVGRGIMDPKNVSGTYPNIAVNTPFPDFLAKPMARFRVARPHVIQDCNCSRVINQQPDVRVLLRFAKRFQTHEDC